MCVMIAAVTLPEIRLSIGCAVFVEEEEHSHQFQVNLHSKECLFIKWYLILFQFKSNINFIF